jgi:hypothetical protein
MASTNMYEYVEPRGPLNKCIGRPCLREELLQTSFTVRGTENKDRKRTYDVTLRRVRATTVAVEKQ